VPRDQQDGGKYRGGGTDGCAEGGEAGRQEGVGDVADISGAINQTYIYFLSIKQVLNMPFFNNRPKKHGGNNKPEAKMPIIVAQKAAAHHLHLTIS
jgi:hypothetical protein